MFYDGVTIGSKSVATALAEQTAQFYGQAAEEWKHHAAWVAQSQHAHVPAPYVGQETAAQQRQTDAAFQARSAGAIRAAQGVPGNLAAVKASLPLEVQQSQAGDNGELLRAILELRALFAKQAAIQQQQPARRPVQKAQARPASYQPYLSKQGYRPTPASGYQEAQAVYSVKDIVRRSVGLPPEQHQPAPKLPVSPITGQPSALRAMIERSVGIK